MRDNLTQCSGKSVVAALLFMLLLTALTACGQKGPLQRPDPNSQTQLTSGSLERS